ncbi:Polyphosphate kinase [Bergeyella zoohelcum]|uniref:Polyphosphate kinase n=1 Tax=Bergeyella zoohelcum TaxID=1015 RepID=A0A380ZUS0_9FLAO|nr:Polyphosphate kinase [Bergeyella zoohelcum]
MYFYNAGEENMYISSADWMTRNLDNRIEAAVPILKKELKKELKDILKLQLSDNVKARILNKALDNEYVKNDLPPVVHR